MAKLSVSQRTVVLVGAATLLIGGVYYYIAGRSVSNEKPPAKKSVKGKQKRVTLDDENIRATSSQEPRSKKYAKITLKEAAERARMRGNKHFERDNIERALQCYTEAITLNPTDTRTSLYYVNRATCYHKQKDYDNEIADCSVALGLNPLYIKAWQRRAKAYEAKGALESAANDHVNVLALESTNAISRSSLTSLMESIVQERVKAAMKEKKGKFPNAAAMKKHLEAMDLVEPPEPLEELQSLVENNPSNAEYIFKLAVKCTTANDFPSALIYAERATKEQPDMYKAHLLCGTLKYVSMDIDSAEKAFEQAQKLGGEETETYLCWANARLCWDTRKRANEVLAKACGLPKTLLSPDLLCSVAQCLLKVDQPQMAIECLDKALALRPDHYQSLVYRAVALMALADPKSLEKAKECLDKAIQSDDSLPDAYNHYGLLLHASEQSSEASKMFDKAIEVAPTGLAGYINKGFLLFRGADSKEDAQRLFEKAIEVDPTSVEAHCNLAMCYLDQDIQKSIEYYKAAAEAAFSVQDLKSIFNFLTGAELRQTMQQAQKIASA